MNSVDDLISDSKTPREDLLGQSENNYAAMMHISQFAGMFIPGLGIVAPIGLWLYGKDKSETVRRHGLHIFNYMIPFHISLVISFMMCFLIVGFLILPFVLLAGLIFPIIGTVKASMGKEWVYPLSYEFFEV